LGTICVGGILFSRLVDFGGTSKEDDGDFSTKGIISIFSQKVWAIIVPKATIDNIARKGVRRFGILVRI
jgi:hypothetical protein